MTYSVNPSMGITIVNKSDPKEKKDNPKLALVLAGGAISGGAFKVGGLKALNDYLVNKKVTDFDIYVGLSAGAFLAAPLSGGIPPEEMLASLDGKSKHFSQLSPLHLYKPNWREFVARPLKYLYGHLTFFPGILYDLFSAFPNLRRDVWKNVKNLALHPNYSNYEQLMKPLLRVAYSTRSIPALGELIPSGICDNVLLESYLRHNMKKNRMTNNFRVLKKMLGHSLYISAMNLDTADRVIFGPDEKNDVSISQAIQASTAIPGFYKPARIKGVDYVDGGVRKTANIDVALDKGADLVICYNPFRPFNNELVIEYLREENKYVTKSKRISDWGLGMVFNQVFRTLFHSRLMYAIQTYREDPNFKKDILIIEPKEDDSDFFELNPLFFWNRARSASHGFESVSRSIENKFDQISSLLGHYGIEMSRDVVKMDAKKIEKSLFDPNVIMDVLEEPQPKRRLKVVQGGK
ncbi:MAG: patatin-like phospholipase family protein [Deltaproteobacteria bacterium]|nr:patatin-like phospholipase family protein [Deltaproteobacteria bacterium]